MCLKIKSKQFPSKQIYSSPAHKHTKNKGEQEFLVKTVEFDFSTDPKGGLPKTSKQASYNKSNASVMHQMHQTPTPLELKQKGEEKRLLPAKKVGVTLKQSANQSSVFEEKSKYDNRKAMPHAYENYRPKAQPLRNQGNAIVEQARASTYASNVF